MQSQIFPMRIFHFLISQISFGNLVFLSIIVFWLNIFTTPTFNSSAIPIILRDHYVFNLAVDCIRKSGSPHRLGIISLHPFKERREHYLQILNITAPYLYTPPYCYVQFCGPWCEELWRDLFIHQPLEEFGPFIPIFVPWTNIYHLTPHDYKTIKQTFKIIFRMLKKEYLYITVVQHVFGLEVGKQIWKLVPQDVFIISPSGRGHLPVPHLSRN
jgi:hypothetical protein